MDDSIKVHFTNFVTSNDVNETRTIHSHIEHYLLCHDYEEGVLNYIKFSIKHFNIEMSEYLTYGTEAPDYVRHKAFTALKSICDLSDFIITKFDYKDTI